MRLRYNRRFTSDKKWYWDVDVHINGLIHRNYHYASAVVYLEPTQPRNENNKVVVEQHGCYRHIENGITILEMSEHPWYHIIRTEEKKMLITIDYNKRKNEWDIKLRRKNDKKSYMYVTFKGPIITRYVIILNNKVVVRIHYDKKTSHCVKIKIKQDIKQAHKQLYDC